MRLPTALLLALPLLAAASSTPAKRFALTPRDDDPEDQDDLHAVCSVSGKEPKDCGSGFCCFYYEQCQAGQDGSDEPWCLDMSLTSVGGDPFSVIALQFATTGFESSPAQATATTTSATQSPHGASATGAAQSSGAAVPLAGGEGSGMGVLGLGVFVAGLVGGWM